jgi:hypothetical protein
MTEIKEMKRQTMWKSRRSFTVPCDISYQGDAHCQTTCLFGMRTAVDVLNLVVGIRAF